MKFTDILLKLSKVPAEDISGGLSALEAASKNVSLIAQNFSELVGQAKVVVDKVQSISKKMDDLSSEG